MVVGVVGDVKENGIRAKDQPQVYYPLPLALAFNGYAFLTLRTYVPPATVLSAIRSQIRSLDSGLAVFEAKTMDEVIATDTRDASLQTILLGAFALLALVLAAIGLYGMMSYLVSRRTREIGIRMALGAQKSSVLGLIMRQGSKLTLIGLALGVLVALALTRSMSSVLYGVAPADPLTFLVVTFVLALVASAAHYLPARRAAKVDPMRALRHE